MGENRTLFAHLVQRKDGVKLGHDQDATLLLPRKKRIPNIPFKCVQNKFLIRDLKFKKW